MGILPVLLIYLAIGHGYVLIMIVFDIEGFRSEFASVPLESITDAIVSIFIVVWLIISWPVTVLLQLNQWRQS